MCCTQIMFIFSQTTLDLQVRKKLVQTLRLRQSYQQAKLETVEIITTPRSGLRY